jgi:hypothetical protein
LFSNDRDPVIPASLAGIVYSVQGLNNIQRMHPSLRGSHDLPGPDYSPGPGCVKGPNLHGDGDRTKRLAPLGGSKSDAAPNITNLYYDPTDIYSSQAYDYNALYALGHCCNPNGNANNSPPDASGGWRRRAAFWHVCDPSEGRIPIQIIGTGASRQKTPGRTCHPAAQNLRGAETNADPSLRSERVTFFNLGEKWH